MRQKSQDFDPKFWRHPMNFDINDTVGGYAVPVDPMDMLQCDSCQ